MSQLGIRFDLFPPDRIQERFEKFDSEHPEVYARIKQAAFALRDAGRTRFGIAAIWEWLRYHTGVGDRDAEYRLDNSFRSRYVRKLIAEHPEFEPLVEIRRLRLEPRDDTQSTGGAPK